MVSNTTRPTAGRPTPTREGDRRARNELLRDGLTGVKRIPLARALTTVQRTTISKAYVADLPNVVDLHVISAEGIRIGADPLGGPASTTGVRSPSGTTSLSPWSTRWSTRRGGS